jgi:hypothetical protein
MRGNRRLAGAIVAALLAEVLAVGAVQAAAAPNPVHNLPLSSRQLALCYEHGSRYSTSCKKALIFYLDRARQRTGLPPYRLPADFLELSPAKEILILTNLDRTAYSLDPIVGLSRDLDRQAMHGARASGDPVFEPSPQFPAGSVYQWGSNWAGGQAPLLLAYYLWMYDDGYGSANLACQSPDDPGCWGHRQNVLLEPMESAQNQLQLSLGAAVAASQSYTMLIVAADEGASPSYYYTWQQAQADGAGRHTYRVKRPTYRPSRLTSRHRVRESGPA